MKRRARLRPRGTLRRDDALPGPERDDDRRGELDREFGTAIDSPQAGHTLRGLHVGDGGIAVDAVVAAGVAGVARVATDHGRELRALRTARARRLAIALGLARGARPG